MTAAFAVQPHALIELHCGNWVIRVGRAHRAMNRAATGATAVTLLSVISSALLGSAQDIPVQGAVGILRNASLQTFPSATALRPSPNIVSQVTDDTGSVTLPSAFTLVDPESLGQLNDTFTPPSTFADLKLSSSSGSPAPSASLAKDRPFPVAIIVATIITTISLVGIIGNTLVVFVIAVDHSLKERVPNLIIGNLAVTDLGTCVLVMLPCATSLAVDHWPFGSAACQLHCCLNYLFIIASMMSLALVSLDRKLAIQYPLRYTQTVKATHLIAPLVCIWICGWAFGIAPMLLGWISYDYWEAVCAIGWFSHHGTFTYVIVAFCVCFVVPAFFILWSNRVIISTSRNVARRRRLGTVRDTDFTDSGSRGGQLSLKRLMDGLRSTVRHSSQVDVQSFPSAEHSSGKVARATPDLGECQVLSLSATAAGNGKLRRRSFASMSSPTLSPTSAPSRLWRRSTAPRRQRRASVIELTDKVVDPFSFEGNVDNSICKYVNKHTCSDSSTACQVLSITQWEGISTTKFTECEGDVHHNARNGSTNNVNAKTTHLKTHGDNNEFERVTVNLIMPAEVVGKQGGGGEEQTRSPETKNPKNGQQSPESDKRNSTSAEEYQQRENHRKRAGSLEFLASVRDEFHRESPTRRTLPSVIDASTPLPAPRVSSIAQDASRSRHVSSELQRRAFQSHRRVLRSILIVVAVFFICMTPFCVTKLIKIIVQTPDFVPGWLNLLATVVQFLSSAVNPFIYGFFRPDFKRAFLRVFRNVRRTLTQCR